MATSDQNPYEAPRENNSTAMKTQLISKSVFRFRMGVRVAGIGLIVLLGSWLCDILVYMYGWDERLYPVFAAGVVCGFLTFVVGLFTAMIYGIIWIVQRRTQWKESSR